MKYLKKKEKKKKNPLAVILIVCVILLLIAVAAAVALHFAGGTENKPGQETVQQTDAEGTPGTEPKTTGAASETTGGADETQYEEAPLQDLEVVTNYGTFLLSGHWHGAMRAEVMDGEVYMISAYGQVGSQQEQHLFDVCFGGSEGSIVGYVADGKGNYVTVNVVLSDFEPNDSWSETEKLEFYGMQNEVNSIIGQLELVAEDEIGNVSNSDDMQIETPYLTLTYPGTWGDRVRAEVSGEETVTVSFFGTPAGAQEVHLFDIVLGGSEESAVGIFTTDDGKEVMVQVVDGNTEPGDGWTEETLSEFYAMMDGINHILSGLEETGSFRFS